MKYRTMMITSVIPFLLFSFVSLADTYFSTQYKDKDDPAKYLPIEIGNKWTYQNKYNSSITDNTQESITVTWESDIVVQDHHFLPEGLLVIRKESIQNVVYDYPDTMEEDISWFKENIAQVNDSHLLLNGNYVYKVPDFAWLKKSNCLTEEFKTSLTKGKIIPDFFFPLGSVGVWAEKTRELADIGEESLFVEGKGPAPRPVMYYWMLEENEDVQVPYGHISDAFKLIYRTNSGPMIRWFKPDIGIVKEVCHHQGSLYGEESVLVSFTKSTSSKTNPNP
jgi:hypothetical protein